MQPFNAVFNIFIRLAVGLGLRSVYPRKEHILARLQNSTSIHMQPEISEAWNERRIIRERLQAYGSK